MSADCLGMNPDKVTPMAKIVDPNQAIIISETELSLAVGEQLSYRTESGRVLSLAEVAMLKARRLEQQVCDLQEKLEQMQAGK